MIILLSKENWNSTASPSETEHPLPASQRRARTIFFCFSKDLYTGLNPEIKVKSINAGNFHKMFRIVSE